MQDCVLLDDVVPIDVASLAHLSVLQSLSGILFEDNNCAGTLAFGDIGNALLDAGDADTLVHVTEPLSLSGILFKDNDCACMPVDDGKPNCVSERHCSTVLSGLDTGEEIEQVLGSTSA